MGQTRNEGIINDILELAMMTPAYDDANHHEHHSRIRDFLLDVKDLAFRIVDAKAQRLAAFKAEQDKIAKDAAKNKYNYGTQA